MSDTPEEDRLVDRLFNNPRFKLRNFHVSWGPEAHLLNREQRAAQINHALDQVDRGEGEVLDFEDSQIELEATESTNDISEHLPQASIPKPSY